MNQHFNIKRTAYAIMCLCLIFVPYFLLGPMEIYVGNILEFTFSWTDFVMPAIFLFVVCSVIPGLIISLFPDAIYNVVTNILVCIGILSYIQAMFMNIKLVEPDGNHLNMSSLGSFFYINGLIWILFIIIFIVLSIKLDKKLWKNICTGICGFLIAIQAVAFISLLITTDTDVNKRKYQFSGEEQFVISENENIFVLILDAYPNVFFDYACENIKGFEAPLKDFTYYTNAESVYIPTFPAIPCLLTGQDFYFAETNDVWFDDVWSRDEVVKFYDMVHEKDYVFNLFTEDTHSVVGLYENVGGGGKIDNAVRTEISVDKTGLLKLITKMSAFRYVPYVLKPYFEVLTYEYNDVITYAHEDSAFNNDEFHQKLKERGFSFNNTGKNMINVTHILGMHNSVKLDESLDTQAELAEIVSDYLDALKQIGKYDDSSIIITSDHGKYDYGEYQPIMFVKRKNETHDTLKRTNAPVSHADFMPTILELIGCPTSSYGKSIFDFNENEKRKRIHNFVSANKRTIDSIEYEGDINDLIDAMNEYFY